MRLIALNIVLISSLLPSAFGQAPPLSRMDIVLKSVPNGPVAKVRGANIARSEFIRFYTSELARITSRTSAPMTMEARAELGYHCLRVLVQQELLYQEAQSRGLQVTEAEVSETWNREKQELLARSMETSGKEMTESQLLEMLGFSSESEAKAELRRSMLISRMARKVLSDANAAVDDSAIREFYDSRKQDLARPEMLTLQQIFIRAEAGKSPRVMKAREDARMKAEDILKRVRSGQSFDGLVRQYSDGSRKNEGGIAGPLPLKAFPPFMSDAALKLQPGEVSDILESDVGYHIVKLIEFTAGEEPKLEDAKEGIRRVLEGRESEKIVAEFCESLVKSPSDLQVFIEIDKNLAHARN